MATVYCSQCGTHNREGTKQCITCGARLERPSGLACGMCGTINALDSVECSNCKARLVPLILSREAEQSTSSTSSSIREVEKKPAPAKSLAPPPTDIPESEVLIEGAAENKEDDSLDWLARLRAAPPEVETELPPEISEDLASKDAKSSEETSEFPSWLAKSVEDKSQEESTPSAASQEQDPTWIREAAEFVTPIPSSRDESSEPDAELKPPTWLEGMPAETTPEEKTPAADIPEDPSWVSRIKTEGTTESAAPVAEESKELPEWLRTPTGESTTAESPTEKIAEPVAEDEVPEWLRLAIEPTREEKQPEIKFETPEPVTEQIEEKPAEPTALPELMPDWISALKPVEEAAPPPPIDYATESAEASGPLAGLYGVLPVSAMMTEPSSLVQFSPLAEKRNGAHLFEAILAEPLTMPEKMAARKARRGLTSKPFIYLLCAVVIVIAFVLRPDLTGAALKISGTPTAEFYDTIQTLPNNSTVVLSFDYDPSVAGEMDLQANALVNHLVQRRVKIIAVSTLDTGPQIAQRVLDSAVSGARDYTYGTSYLNLGYLPGNEAGLAQLAVNGLPMDAKDFVRKQPVSQIPLAVGARNLRGVAMVVVLAGTEDRLKLWMEQVQARANARVAAGVSAAVEPKARVYRDAKQLTAMMSGIVGAAQYELLSNKPGLAIRSMTAQSAGQVVLLLVIVAGNIAYWISRVRAKK